MGSFGVQVWDSHVAWSGEYGCTRDSEWMVKEELQIMEFKTSLNDMESVEAGNTNKASRVPTQNCNKIV